MLIIVVSTFISIAFIVMAIYWLMFRPVSATAQRLHELDDNRSTGVHVSSIEQDPVESFAEKLAEPINRLAPPSAASVKKLQLQLMQAGYRSPSAVAVYRVTQLFSMLLFPLALVAGFSTFGWSLGDAFIPALCALAIGFIL